VDALRSGEVTREGEAPAEPARSVAIASLRRARLGPSRSPIPARPPGGIPHPPSAASTGSDTDRIEVPAVLGGPRSGLV